MRCHQCHKVLWRKWIGNGSICFSRVPIGESWSAKHAMVLLVIWCKAFHTKVHPGISYQSCQGYCLSLSSPFVFSSPSHFWPLLSGSWSISALKFSLSACCYVFMIEITSHVCQDQLFTDCCLLCCHQCCYQSALVPWYSFAQQPYMLDRWILSTTG